MKSKVQLSLYCKIITCVAIVLLIVGVFSSWGVERKFVLGTIVLVCLVGAGLFYSPRSIEASDASLVIHRVLKSKVIPYSDISSVDSCIPSAGGLRLCGSGGFMGYWGYFSDIIIGSYFGYYGDMDQCILVKLKNGKQYVISCCDSHKMIEAIEANL